MTKPDRAAFARRHAAWLIPTFGAFLLWGIMRQNFLALAGGALGLGWVALAVLSARSGQ